MRLDKATIRQASPLESVIPNLLGVELRLNGNREPSVRCPFHEDHKPSLRINLDRQVWRCDPCGFGGDVFQFVQRLKGLQFPAAMRWLAEQGHMGEQERRVIKAYDYQDEHGSLVYQVVRYEPKDFRQRRPDGLGGWIWKMTGVRPLVYRRPQLTGREAVAIVGGEKDADTLWANRIPATTNSGGETKWTAEHSAQLVAAGVKRVLVIPDNDDKGRQHAAMVAGSCVAAGLTAKVLTLPDVPAKGDVSDYLTTHTLDELIELMKSAPTYQPVEPTTNTASGCWLSR